MTCDEVEQLISVGEVDGAREALGHLAGCPSCRAYRDSAGQVLSVLAPERVSPLEEARLSELGDSLAVVQVRREGYSQGLRQGAALTLAAGLGAFVAVVALHRGETTQVAPWPTAPAAQVALAEASQSESETEFAWLYEVSWPEEGESP